MAYAVRSTLSLLILASLTLCACEEEQTGIHQLVLAEGETEGAGKCSLLAKSLFLGGGDFSPADSDDDYRQYMELGNSQAKFWFFIRPEPDVEGERHTRASSIDPPMRNLDLGALALEIVIDLDHFAHGAQLDSFATRDGVEHAVYTWAEADCEETHSRVPQRVLDKVAAR